MSQDLEIRRLEPGDQEAVLELIATSLGWEVDDLHAGFLRWKHEENPAGASPGWVAVDEDRIAGVRILLRWRFADATGALHDAVRAVDTATHPDYRGQGVFSRLTMAAVSELTESGTEFVFNTPNAQSKPGYLKMGWSELGALPIGVRPRSLASLLRVARARTPAELWSEPCGAGLPASEAFADAGGVASLLSTLQRPAALHTERTADHLRWRYGFEPLHYRVMTPAGGVGQGAVVFRLRRRGPALEAAICEVLVPGANRKLTRSLVQRVLRESGADYAVGMSLGLRHSFVPLPRQGPVLTRRPLADPNVGDLSDFSFGLGDIELF